MDHPRNQRSRNPRGEKHSEYQRVSTRQPGQNNGGQIGEDAGQRTQVSVADAPFRLLTTTRLQMRRHGPIRRRWRRRIRASTRHFPWIPRIGQRWWCQAITGNLLS